MRYVHVKVIAGAREEEFIKESEDHFKISVRERALRNMANKRVFELVAEHFGLTENKVRIISGHRAPSKLLIVDD